MPMPHVSPVLSRRSCLGIGGASFALIPLASLLADKGGGHQAPSDSHVKRVRRVILLFMNGGPSHIDTFDPKPQLAKYDGQSYAGEKKVASGTRIAGELWKSEFRFNRHGESGLEISELFPALSQHADDLCVIRSMHTTDALHAPAILRMNTGRSRQGGASLGAWVDYGLGTLNENLPQFVVMLDHRGAPINGHANWGTAPLPVNAATVFESPGDGLPYREGMRNLQAIGEQRMRQLLKDLNELGQLREPASSHLTERMRAYELAWRMQSAMPDTVSFEEETQDTQQRYGLDRPATTEFGTRCLLARRLLERGVRFVQIYSGGGQQQHTWDAHTKNNERHRRFAGETDQPIAALLADLKQRGLWNETLVIWGGEFGRTPTREMNSKGRDHNPYGFTIWLAGGAVRGGHVVGATDEIGLEAVEAPCSVDDLHATILRLLGLDHETLKFYGDGGTTGLTGPEPCQVIQEVLA
ncbi:MAG: DUF1501 domain-containing protein [Planctomycetaceae bacterium]|nr:DUF1501 domain-containing protein [Planctomycetaceae bacterium]